MDWNFDTDMDLEFQSTDIDSIRNFRVRILDFIIYNRYGLSRYFFCFPLFQRTAYML